MNVAVSVRAQWVDGGTPVCSAQYDQSESRMTHGPMGSAYIAWADYRQGFFWDIYIQRMARSGHALWTIDGIAVCIADGDQTAPTVVADGEDGVIVIWQDERTGSNGIDLYAQRFDLDGNQQWDIDGVLVTGALGDQTYPMAVSDGSGGVIVFYSDDSGTDDDYYMQRVRSSGDLAWDPSGLPAAAGAGDQMVSVLSDGRGGAFLSVFNIPPSGTATIYAQRVDSSGTQVWGVPGIPVWLESGYSSPASLASDGKGGIFLFWSDLREILNHRDIYAQRIDRDGAVLWVENGVSICSMDEHQIQPYRAIPDGEGGAIVVFSHAPLYVYDGFDIYAQRIDSLGTKLWGDACAAVCTAPNHQGLYWAATDGAGGAIISWVDCRYSSNIDPYIQRLGSDGTPLWTVNGIRVSSALGSQYVLGCISDGEGGAIVNWDDGRNGYFDIYAQRIGGDGGIVATTLAHMVSNIDGRGVTLEWMLSEEAPDAAFAISRKDGPEAG
ncbi:MAG: hypothetical protein ACXQTG_06610, partial [Methanoculleaceae archaeon]